MESSCHFSLQDGKRWNSLRERFAENYVPTPEKLKLQLSIVVEAGALFFDLARPDANRRGWYAFKPAEAQQYRVLNTEAGEL